MFGSTYICESIFSCMKRLKSDERNRMSDEKTLDARLRLSTSEIEANIDTIVKSKALNNEQFAICVDVFRNVLLCLCCGM